MDPSCSNYLKLAPKYLLNELDVLDDWDLLYSHTMRLIISEAVFLGKLFNSVTSISECVPFLNIVLYYRNIINKLSFD